MINLLWQFNLDKGVFTYAEAMLYASYKKGVWRIPTIDELAYTLDSGEDCVDMESRALPFFKPMFGIDWFWSSTPSIYTPNEMMIMNYRTGRALSNSVYNRVRLCCVRDV